MKSAGSGDRAKGTRTAMTNQPEQQPEPLNNVNLESAILGLKMALTPEEEQETREEFLKTLSESMLAVPTVNQVPTGPDGAILPNADITFIVAQTHDGKSGVPAFTALGGLRAAMPQAQNGVFLSGAQLGAILGNSPHYLFVDGPDMHAEVSQEELRGIAAKAQAVVDEQQAAAQHNVALEEALTALNADDTDATREATTAAFLNGFCRIPVAGEADRDTPVVILRMGNPEQPETVQEIPLITRDESLLCFTSEEAMKAWDDEEPHNAIALPGGMIAQLVAQTGVPSFRINPGSDTSKALKIDENRLVIV